MLIENLAPCKVKCENWYWNKKLQEHLLTKNVSYGFSDGKSKWVKSRLFLVIQTRKHFTENRIVTWISWTTEREFSTIGMPEYSAKQLLELLQND